MFTFCPTPKKVVWVSPVVQSSDQTLPHKSFHFHFRFPFISCFSICPHTNGLNSLYFRQGDSQILQSLILIVGHFWHIAILFERASLCKPVTERDRRGRCSKGKSSQTDCQSCCQMQRHRSSWDYSNGINRQLVGRSRKLSKVQQRMSGYISIEQPEANGRDRWLHTTKIPKQPLAGIWNVTVQTKRYSYRYSSLRLVTKLFKKLTMGSMSNYLVLLLLRILLLVILARLMDT